MSGKRVKSAAELNRELKRLGGLSDDKFVEVIRKLSFDGFNSLVRLTPVDTGFARSNWRVGVNATQEGTIRASATGAIYTASSYGNPQIEVGDIVHLYNNVVYMERLEKGWSRQAPAGMVQPTYSRLTAQAHTLANTLSKESIG